MVMVGGGHAGGSVSGRRVGKEVRSGVVLRSRRTYTWVMPKCWDMIL